MLYKERIAVCSRIHTEHINTLCGQNVELLNIKLVVHIVTTGLEYSIPHPAMCYIYPQQFFSEFTIASDLNCFIVSKRLFNPLKTELNPICYLLALLAHHFLHVSRIRVKSLTFRRLMSYTYMEHPFLMFLDHTQRHSTVGRTPLDE